MADIAETEDSALDCDEDSGKGPSQGLPQLEVCSAASFPDHQVSKKKNSGLCSLKPSRRKAKKARCGPSSENTVGGQTLGVSSTGSVKSKSCLKLPKPKIDLRAFFDYYFVRKQHRKKRWRTKRWWLCEKETTECQKKRRRRKSPKGQYPKIPVIERKKRYRDKGLRFPFLEKLCGRRHLPFKYVHRYEQEALQGYFRYVEALKCEQHLKKSLTKLNAADDLENESLESRKYKYLDDDGSLSPIEETSEEDQNKNSSNDDIGARIVEVVYGLHGLQPGEFFQSKEVVSMHAWNCKMNELYDRALEMTMAPRPYENHCCSSNQIVARVIASVQLSLTENLFIHTSSDVCYKC